MLGSAPWRRAPLLLRRSSAVLLAVLAAGLILGTAAAATPLFLTSVANAALAEQMEERCPPTYGFQVRTTGALGGPVSAEEARHAAGLGEASAWPAGRELLALRERTVRRAGAVMPNLGQPVLTMSGPLIELAGPSPGPGSGGRLLSRDGFEGQIRKLATAPGVTGVWLPSETATQLRARPGDRVTLSLTGRSAPVRVAIYQELHRLPPTPYWCAQSEEIYPPGYAEDPPPPLVSGRPGHLHGRQPPAPGAAAGLFWDLQLAPGLTLAEARASAAAFPAASEAMAVPAAA